MTPHAEISCRHCGCCDGVIGPGKGPHAYEIKCTGCGGHYKWASVLDVEDFTPEQLAERANKDEWAAIHAARAGSWSEFYKYAARRDKIREKL
jgi:hypothetical protein